MLNTMYIVIIGVLLMGELCVSSLPKDGRSRGGRLSEHPISVMDKKLNDPHLEETSYKSPLIKITRRYHKMSLLIEKKWMKFIELSRPDTEDIFKRLLNKRNTIDINAANDYRGFGTDASTVYYIAQSQILFGLLEDTYKDLMYGIPLEVKFLNQHSPFLPQTGGWPDITEHSDDFQIVETKSLVRIFKLVSRATYTLKKNMEDITEYIRRRSGPIFQDFDHGQAAILFQKAKERVYSNLRELPTQVTLETALSTSEDLEEIIEELVVKRASNTLNLAKLFVLNNNLYHCLEKIALGFDENKKRLLGLPVLGANLADIVTRFGSWENDDELSGTIATRMYLSTYYYKFKTHIATLFKNIFHERVFQEEIDRLSDLFNEAFQAYAVTKDAFINEIERRILKEGSVALQVVKAVIRRALDVLVKSLERVVGGIYVAKHLLLNLLLNQKSGNTIYTLFGKLIQMVFDTEHLQPYKPYFELLYMFVSKASEVATVLGLSDDPKVKDEFSSSTLTQDYETSSYGSNKDQRNATTDQGEKIHGNTSSQDSISKDAPVVRVKGFDNEYRETNQNHRQTYPTSEFTPFDWLRNMYMRKNDRFDFSGDEEGNRDDGTIPMQTLRSRLREILQSGSFERSREDFENSAYGRKYGGYKKHTRMTHVRDGTGYDGHNHNHMHADEIPY